MTKSNNSIITRKKYINARLKSFKIQLEKWLPEKAYKLEFDDIFNNVKETLC